VCTQYGRVHASLLALAPGGVCRRRVCHQPRGALLPHRFTLTVLVAQSGGLFSVALSCELPRLAVSQHPALWSSDFPPARPSRLPDLRQRSPGAASAVGGVAQVFGLRLEKNVTRDSIRGFEDFTTRTARRRRRQYTDCQRNRLCQRRTRVNMRARLFRRSRSRFRRGYIACCALRLGRTGSGSLSRCNPLSRRRYSCRCYSCTDRVHWCFR
jgi:hypothetical protein